MRQYYKLENWLMISCTFCFRGRKNRNKYKEYQVIQPSTSLWYMPIWHWLITFRKVFPTERDNIASLLCIATIFLPKTLGAVTTALEWWILVQDKLSYKTPLILLGDTSRDNPKIFETHSGDLTEIWVFWCSAATFTHNIQLLTLFLALKRGCLLFSWSTNHWLGSY